MKEEGQTRSERRAHAQGLTQGKVGGGKNASSHIVSQICSTTLA
jgi:hypothetical protein